MKKSLALILSVALVISLVFIPNIIGVSAATPYSQGFESGTFSYKNECYSISNNPAHAHTGSSSLHIDGTGLTWTLQGIALTPQDAGATYVMDFWYKTISGSGATFSFVPVFSSSTNVWTGGKYPVGYAGDNSNFEPYTGVGANFIYFPWAGKEIWQHTSIKYTVPSDVGYNNTLWFNFVCQADASVDMYIDDISITPVYNDSVVYEFVDTHETDGNVSLYLSGTPGYTIGYTPVREHFTFDGWYTDSALTNKVTKYPSNTAKLYAKWTIDQNVSSVTFDANGGINRDLDTKLYNDGDVIDVKNPVRPGYDFLGWFDKNGNKVTVAHGALDLTAQWSRIIGFESFYRTSKNHMGYAVQITDSESAVGSKSAYYGYTSDNWNAPVLTPVFAKPGDWTTSYKNYFAYENGKIVSLKKYATAPDFVSGGVYSAEALTSAPADFSTNYSAYSYISGNSFVRLSSATTFTSGKYYRNGYGRNDSADAFFAVGKVLDGMKYTVKFKYKVGSDNANTLKVTAMNYPIYDINYANVVKYTDNAFTVPSASKDGNWHEGIIQFTADAEIVNGITSDTLGLYVSAATKGTAAELYIDDVTVTETSGQIEGYYGDVNADGVINMVDFVRLKKYLAGKAVEVSALADVDVSGGVPDSADFVRLKSVLLGDVQPIVKQAETNILAGKKWAVVGDSLTDSGNSTAAVRYYDIIADKYGMTTTMLGKSGTGYMNGMNNGISFYHRVNSVPADSDLITILGSVNDNSFTLGTPSDTTTNSICGSLRCTIQALKQKCPNAKIIVITQLPAGGNSPSWDATTGAAHNGAVYKRQICEELGVGFLDAYHNSDMESWNAEFVATYFWHSDACHPNLYGNEIYYNQIEQAIRTAFGI